MKGKTVVITGGTSGIGEIAAERLAQMGAKIVLIARSKSRGKVTLARLHEKAPDLANPTPLRLTLQLLVTDITIFYPIDYSPRERKSAKILVPMTVCECSGLSAGLADLKALAER